MAISKWLITFSLLFAFFSCTTDQTEISQHWSAYKVAMKNADVTSAIAEVNAVLAYDTTNQNAIDTLSRLYFIQGNSFGAYNLGIKIAEKKSNIW